MESNICPVIIKKKPAKNNPGYVRETAYCPSCEKKLPVRFLWEGYFDSYVYCPFCRQQVQPIKESLVKPKITLGCIEPNSRMEVRPFPFVYKKKNDRFCFYCPICDEEVFREHIFCHSCGQQLKEIKQKK